MELWRHFEHPSSTPSGIRTLASEAFGLGATLALPLGLAFAFALPLGLAVAFATLAFALATAGTAEGAAAGRFLVPLCSDPAAWPSFSSCSSSAADAATDGAGGGLGGEIVVATGDGGDGGALAC